MKEVIATKPGYLGKLREPGERFMVEDDLEASWFEPVERDEEPKKPEPKKPAAAPRA